MWGLLLLPFLFLEAYAFCDGRSYMPHEQQCDAYYDCTSGTPVEKLCPDGLFFNPYASSELYICQYPIDVDCSSRPLMQPAVVNGECPRKYGYFLAGGPTQCNMYVNCVNGNAFHMQCPEGLAFNLRSYVCDWPDQVEDCDAAAYVGFTCAPNSFGNHPSRECSRYISCVDGAPRLMSCPYGTGFSAATSTCVHDAECLGGGGVVPHVVHHPPVMSSGAAAGASSASSAAAAAAAGAGSGASSAAAAAAASGGGAASSAAAASSASGSGGGSSSAAAAAASAAGSGSGSSAAAASAASSGSGSAAAAASAASSSRGSRGRHQ